MSGPDRVEARPRIPQRDPRDSVVPVAQIGAAAPATWDSARIAANPQKAQTRAMEGFQKAAGVAQGVPMPGHWPTHPAMRAQP